MSIDKIMKVIKKISYRTKVLLRRQRDKQEEKRRIKKYKDYNGRTDYDCGEYKFIWGVKSNTDLSNSPACLHTVNDIDLIYCRSTKKYTLNIETAIWFDDKNSEIEYLEQLLDNFSRYMEENDLPKNEPYKFWMSQPFLLLDGYTIPEVYTGFKIFVNGYKAVYQSAQQEL